MVAAVLDRVRTRFHEARADAFVQLMRPWQGARLLDLGGGDGSLAERIAQRVPMRVVVADAATDAREAATGRGLSTCYLIRVHRYRSASETLTFSSATL